MNIRVFDSVGDLAAAAADELLRRIESGARVIGLSGGSTPRVLYSLLAGPEYREKLERRELIWVVEDERYVPPDHADSNSRMIQQALFRSGLPKSQRFLRFRTELGDPPATAKKFEEEWRELRLEGLDVAILGAGEDGHTASLFPGTDIMEVREGVAREVWVARLNTWRVTLTLPVLQKTMFKYVLVTGASKRAVVQRAQKGEDLPIVRVTRGEGESWWLLDREA